MRTRKTYLRNPFTNKPFGVAVLINNNGDYRFGYSLCNPNDQFDKKRGTKIALGRANCTKFGEDQVILPVVPLRRMVIVDTFRQLVHDEDAYCQRQAQAGVPA